MNDRFADIEHVQRMHAEGRHGDLLSFLEQRYAEAEASPAPARNDYFMTMFQWKMLIEDYPPAAAALAGARDEQVRRLLAGEVFTGSAAASDDERVHFERVRRFALIVDMNATLADPHATHALFLQLVRQQPELARRYAWQALPDIVEAGDFALADRYRGDPLDRLASANEAALRLPLLPPEREPPRLVAELNNLTRDVRIGIAVLRGLGREAEAAAVRASVLEGLANEELRELAGRELDEPGTITRMLVEHQMAQEGAG